MKYEELAYIRDVLSDIDHQIWFTEELNSGKNEGSTNYNPLEEAINQSTGYLLIKAISEKISRALMLVSEQCWKAPDAPECPF